MKALPLVAFVAAFAGCAALAASAPPNPMNGMKLAEQWCAQCHDIESGAPFKKMPPSFASIAVFFPESAIRDKIIVPVHPKMPSTIWVLNKDEVSDIVAYIESLGPPK